MFGGRWERSGDPSDKRSRTADLLDPNMALIRHCRD